MDDLNSLVTQITYDLGLHQDIWLSYQEYLKIERQTDNEPDTDQVVKSLAQSLFDSFEDLALTDLSDSQLRPIMVFALEQVDWSAIVSNIINEIRDRLAH